MMRILLPLLLLGLVAAMGVSAQTVPAQTVPAPPGTSGATSASTTTTTSANPYSATVPVAGTSDKQRNTAIDDALGKVLEQVSPGSAANPEILSKAAGYVHSYHYQRAASGNGLELQVQFNSGAVRRLIAANQGGTSALGAATPASGSTAPAVAEGGSGDVWVSGIGNSHAFATMLSTLREDPSLHHVVPVAAKGDGVLLHLSFDEPLSAVLAGLGGASGHLEPNSHSHPGADASLEWVP